MADVGWSVATEACVDLRVNRGARFKADSKHFHRQIVWGNRANRLKAILSISSP